MGNEAPLVSVVIPVLDEERRLAKRLDELAEMADIGEVIVVDGGSRDGSVSTAQQRGVAAISSRRGRATQMNVGARAARGEVLLFLHADVSLPADAVAWIRRALCDSRVVAGAFRTWTVDDAGGRRAPWLHLADLRSRYTRLPYGDQALFVRRSAFCRVGGFPEQPLMEDLELSLRLWRVGRVVTVPARVQVSGRRFMQSPVRDTLIVNLFPLLYRLGVSATRLARLYRDVR